MRIREITTKIVNAGDRNWVFVKVTTDEPGLYGWGEASVAWQEKTVSGQVAELGALVIGEDPTRIEHIWQALYRQPFYRGGIVMMSAIAGIDQALWDIRGKVLDQPLHTLLGGRVRDSVRAYDHLYRWELGLDWDDLDQLALAAEKSVEDGFDALKLYPIPVGRPLEGTRALAEAEAYVGTIRDAVGPDVDLMIDMHGRTTPAMAIQYAHLLAQFRPLFIEEPCLPGNVPALAEVARAVTIPVATGERLTSRWEFRELLEQRACAVIQPDASHCGGVSEFRRVAAMAETYFVAVAPHCPVGPIGAAVTAHLSLVTPNFLIMEQLRQDVPWRNTIVDTPLQLEGGRVMVGDRPGIGLELIEEEADAHAEIVPLNYRSYAPDGSVVDD